MKETLELLKDVRDLFEDYGWTQGAFARDAFGGAVNSYAHCACSFCLIGAMERVENAAGFLKSHHAAARVINHIIDPGFVSGETKGVMTNVLEWNDTPGRTKEQVLSVLDRAIEGEEKCQLHEKR